MQSYSIRDAELSDLKELIQIEEVCFSTDRLSSRRFKHWLKAFHCIFKVVTSGSGLAGYGLVLLHRGTRLARLYSMAVLPAFRGQGLSRKLLADLESAAVNRGRLYMRLEVSENNDTAIALYRSMKYRAFGEYENYYQDHSDALRMQKQIRHIVSGGAPPPIPWYHQSTNFTCGPSSLMMAMASLDGSIVPSQELELDIWREATTIFMTSGHGGCHPLGLALAAHSRGFTARVYVNTRKPLFVDGVRTECKKEIMTLVNNQFLARAREVGLKIHYKDITQKSIERYLKAGAGVVILISTYRLEGRKLPHWVAVTAVDDLCLYVHDPDPSEDSQDPLDCQHMPIAREDFARMSVFGSDRLRTAVILEKAG
jgi:ribosomal protein S18 acetylase RimI-like enzyme